VNHDKAHGDSLMRAAEGQPGTLKVGGDKFAAHLLDMPTIVETYKTYDDVHLVKSNDIGQVCHGGC